MEDVRTSEEDTDSQDYNIPIRPRPSSLELFNKNFRIFHADSVLKQNIQNFSVQVSGHAL